jgi:small-conductance mechanosensitive channel
MAIVLFLALFVALSFMIRKLKELNKEFVLHQLAPHLNTSVFFSCLFLAVTVAQLFYTNIPMVFLQIAWIIMVGSALVLFLKELKERSKGIYIGFVFLFLWACFENLLLEATLGERIIMLVASIVGLYLAFRLLRNYKNQADKPQYYKFFIYLFIIQEAIAVVANITGSYTFGRAMAVGGFFNLMLGFLVFQAIVVLKEILVVSYEYYQRKNVMASMLNLLELKRSAERILPIIAWIGWFIIFAKNLNFYDVLLGASIEFLEAPRKLGNIDFTYSSVAIFFVTIWISTLLAKVVAFLLGGGSLQVGSIKKTRFGSSILVLKLVIISLGLLVAFAASGIPMDKITIIIGALGVGIGFGLQTIVNNLVSGIILAFEKPIEIGDQIEVGGRLGKVKEIGIRSSKLATFEGAEVIIPNGDLLSQHLVNWTLSHNHRRVEIIVGVSYGSQLADAKEVLERILNENAQVDKSPAPAVLVHQFNSSSIDFRLLFWTDIEQWISCKSEIIMAIDKGFKEKGIEIPFAQMVVHQAKP